MPDVEHTDSVRSHLRGSSLLIRGRVVGMAINLAVQVLIVRYLTRLDYGAFAYALAMADMVGGMLVLGLDNAMARYAATYHERGERGRLMGLIATSFVVIGTLGTLVIAAVYVGRPMLSGWLNAGPEAISLLLVLIILAPVRALDAVVTSIYGALANPKVIVIRRHLLGPGLKLLAVLVTMVLQGGPTMLAGGLVAAAWFGIVVYLALLGRILGKEGLSDLRRLRPELPSREVIAFSMAIFGSQLIFIFYSTVVVFFLEYFHDADDVAAFQSIRPFARLNEVVATTFFMLFVPVVSRFASRDDRQGVGAAYHQSSLWVTMLSFPVFAVTFGLSDSICVHVLGAEYADAAKLLGVLALGHFVYSTVSLASVMLRTLGHVRIFVAIDLTLLAVAVTLCLTVIPKLGALGVAVTIVTVLMLRAVSSVASIWMLERLLPVPASYVRAYATIALGVAVLVGRNLIGSPLLALDIVLVAATTALVFWVVRRTVRLEELFPELRRLPIVGRWISGKTD